MSLENDSAMRIAKEDFVLLCEQVALLAEEIEKMDRQRDPEGPNGWELRPATVIKEKILNIRERCKDVLDPA